jgi:hypothetical protein
MALAETGAARHTLPQEVRAAVPALLIARTFSSGASEIQLDRHWHQGYTTNRGLVLDGPGNTREIMKAWGVPDDPAGLNVLDIGSLNGAATCEASKRNARCVLALDALPTRETHVDKVIAQLRCK